jgi:hypothetical protein
MEVQCLLISQNRLFMALVLSKVFVLSIKMDIISCHALGSYDRKEYYVISCTCLTSVTVYLHYSNTYNMYTYSVLLQMCLQQQYETEL